MSTQILVEFGMGSSLRRGDYTAAAKRAIENALWHNSINAAELFGFDKSAMQIDVDVAVQKPEALDHSALTALFPYGQASIHPQLGGLDVKRPQGDGVTVIAHAALRVSFDMEPVS